MLTFAPKSSSFRAILLLVSSPMGPLDRIGPHVPRELTFKKSLILQAIESKWKS